MNENNNDNVNDPSKDKHRRLEIQKLDDEQLQEEITHMVDQAEKISRDYEIAFKKAIKEGNFLDKNVYLEVIEIYQQIKNLLLKRGWMEQVPIYNNQIRIYKEKVEKHKKIKEIEAKKLQKKKEIEDSYRIPVQKKEDGMKNKKSRDKFRQDLDEKSFEVFIDNEVDEAERIARDYEIQLKKGNFNIECPYPAVIDIYRKIRNQLNEHGWNEEALLYRSQIDLYKKKLENDINLRKIEAKKKEVKRKFEKIQRFDKRLIQEVQSKKPQIIKNRGSDEKFQQEITDMIDRAERLARGYETKLKKGELDAESTYPEVIKIYRIIRKRLLDKGWNDQAAIYMNQINIYKEKVKKILKLKEIEANKIQHQKEIEKMHKVKVLKKEPIIDKRLDEIKLIEKQKEEKLEKAMSLINEAERMAKSYELKLKKRLSDFESPYQDVIRLYQKAKEILTEIRWETEVTNIAKTIEFYYSKKEKDDNIRELESREEKEEYIVKIPLTEKFYEKSAKEKELLLLEIEKKKKYEQKIFDDVFELMSEAEKLSENYNQQVMSNNILNLKSPYENIIDIYKKAKQKFENTGWTREADKLSEAIDFYRIKYDKDEKLRDYEQEKIKKGEQDLLDERELIEKTRREQDKIFKKEEEIEKIKTQEKEEFEIHKDKAFALMDEAKIELTKNNFENALELYYECRKIFEKINWIAGLNLIKDSIDLIEKRKRDFEKEKEDKEKQKSEQKILEKQLEDEIIKIKDSKKIEKKHRKREIIIVQEQKQLEDEISERAYNLLREGTKLIESNDFDKAYEKYIKARELFTQINWNREVSHINQELLYNLNKKKARTLRLKEYQKKKDKEEAELKQILEIAEEQKQELTRRKIEERRKKIAIAKEDKIDDLELANILVRNFRYNEAVLKLLEKKEILKKKNKLKKIDKINEIIERLKETTQVPIIILDDFSLIDNKDFIKSYEALDRAQKSISKGNLMKTVSELNEAKFNLEKTKINEKIIIKIETLVNNFRKQIGQEIVDTSENEIELEDLKERIAKSRAQRQKRIKNLTKEN